MVLNPEKMEQFCKNAFFEPTNGCCTEFVLNDVIGAIL